MRQIEKVADSPAAKRISEFVETQLAARNSEDDWEIYKVDYGTMGGKRVLPLLLAEQKQLCAYTGAGLDVDRLAKRRPRVQQPPRDDYWFKEHVEHLKSQHQCMEELKACGGVVGRDACDDIDASNLVVAIEVSGTHSEHFGAAIRGIKLLPILPTDHKCESAFLYEENGRILGLDSEGADMIKILKLDHATLDGWRKGALRAYFPNGQNTPEDKIREAISLAEDSNSDILPEFAFVISQVGRAYLAMKEALK